MKEFILENWQLVLSCLLVLISFILSLLRKRPVANVMDKDITDLVMLLPGWIAEAETKFDYGVDKKAFVVDKATCYLKNHLVLSDDEISSWLLVIGAQIEAILDTPRKKKGE